LEGRKVFIRLHNAESLYYAQLATFEKSLLKKVYFIIESRLLKKYEAGIANQATILALSLSDINFYKKQYPAKSTHFLPAFIPWQVSLSMPGKGSYCLYHGNLGINENERAACWLIDNVFNNMDIPLIVAGSNAGKKLQSRIKKNKNISLVANPTDAELQQLIREAQINVIPSFNKTGIKLKLLNALFNGRHCIVNQAAVEGSGVDPLCHVANSPDQFKRIIEKLFDQSFLEEGRTEGLSQYNNLKNAEKIMSMI